MQIARETLDPVKRAQLIAAADAIFIGQDQAVIPFVNPEFLTFINKRVCGLQPAWDDDAGIYPWATATGACQ